MPPRRDGGQRGRGDQQPSTPSPSFQRGGGGGGSGRALLDPGHSQPPAPPSLSSLLSFPTLPPPRATSSVVQATTPRPAQPQPLAPSSVVPTSPASSTEPPAPPSLSSLLSFPTLPPPRATSSVVQATTPRPAQPQPLAPSSVVPTSPASSTGPVEQLSKEVSVKLTLAPPSSSEPLRPPKRPGFGTKGTYTRVRTNHFRTEIADKDIYRYDVTISPEVPSNKINQAVISEIVRSDLGEKVLVYDGRKNLYTSGLLQFPLKDFVVTLTEDSNNDGHTHPGSSTSTGKKDEFKVLIKCATRVDTHNLRQFLSGSGELDVPEETVRILNTALRMASSDKSVVFGRSFFPPPLGPTDKLGGGVELWRGYFHSLRPTQMGLSLNIDVSATAFFEAIYVHKFVSKFCDVKDLSCALPDQDRVKVERALKGVKVQPTYFDCSKPFKITGVSPEPLNQTMFTRDGKTVSIVDYLSERYGITLDHPLLPALQAGSNARPTFLPMELCRIVEGQRYSRKLNLSQVAEILKVLCQRPSEREASIKKIVASNRYNTAAVVKDFGISVKDEPALIKARVLQSPRLKYQNDGWESVVYPHLGAWTMSDKKFENGGRVYRWTLVNFSQEVCREFPSEFSEKLINMCTSKGMFFNRDPIVPIRSADPNQIEKTLVDVHKEADDKLANQNGKYLQLLIIILPDASGSYGKIKRICETELGIVTQCCRPSEASKFYEPYLENLSFKINVKVGGRNVVLKDSIRLVSDKPTIIFGADVTHPSPGDDFSPSIAAVVASMDWPNVTKYRAVVSSQSPREEIIQDLCDPKEGPVTGGMIRELLIAFKEAVGELPSRIIFYRDGVGESQFSEVLLDEMYAIQKACASLKYLPRVTFIVVQKRHHTRLFPVENDLRSLSDRTGNVKPGTVVDTDICHPREHDFYLNSHAGMKGTNRPIHYHVLFDANNFSADDLQALTNNLCYTYARCTRAVSIVSPVYYAHLAAFRARYYLADCESEGEGVRDGNSKFKSLPTIKGNVKEVMFYC